MLRFSLFSCASITAALLLAAAPGLAAESGSADGESAIGISAQQRDPNVRSRPRTRLRVTPRYPRRPYNSFYPLPYGIDYPGPNAIRQCDFRLAQEHRPSGTVIVPRQRCWWVRR